MKLKEIREARGISQRQAALGLNLSPTVYNRYENGTREPSAAMLLVIADFFGVTVDELLGRDAQENQQNEIHTTEARILAAGVDKMPEEQRKRALKIMDLLFDMNANQFDEEGKKDDDTEL